MGDFNEDQIWDAVMESGKGKINYEHFTSLFPFNPDNFLSSIIYGFAVGRNSEVIANKISSQVFMTGNIADLNKLNQFIEDSRSALKLEVTLTTQALQMLDDGAAPEQVFKAVSEALTAS